MPRSVAILGGGVSGMSAAHELVERGFKVDVYESKSIPGGKARSVLVPDSAAAGHSPLPGEHGFRFFPGFYQNLPDVLKRIPYGNNPQGVYSNLVPTSRLEFARNGVSPFVFVSRFPRTLEDWITVITDLIKPELNIPNQEVLFFAGQIWKLLTACEQRLLEQYEMITWWDFLEADNKSQAYIDFFVLGLTRSLVASQPKRASARTVGFVFIRLAFSLVNDNTPSADLLLDGPTNDVWINPWLGYLTGGIVEKFPGAIPVDYHFGSSVSTINCAGGKIESVTIVQDGKESDITADYYLCALPVEVSSKLVSPAMIAADPSLSNLNLLAADVAWMNGIQFYLTHDVPIVPGHVAYVDSEWALTSISQHQFWKNIDLSHLGDGKVQGILSVDISDWTTKSKTTGKTAQDCTNAEEIKQEVWRQMATSLDTGRQKLLPPDPSQILDRFFLDPDISFNGPGGHPTNAEFLFINCKDRWRFRPTAGTKIPNFFIAGDYIQTKTDVACMEGANEAARLAVNAIIQASAANVPLCEIFVYREPPDVWPVLQAFRDLDELKWKLEGSQGETAAFAAASNAGDRSTEPDNHVEPDQPWPR